MPPDPDDSFTGKVNYHGSSTTTINNHLADRSHRILSLGIGYAAWTDTLTLSGNVQTTHLDVDWGASPQTTLTNPFGDATCTAATSANGNTLSVTIDDAYPGFECVVDVNIFNNGGVDAQLTSTERFEGNSQTGNNGQNDPFDAEFDYVPFACDSNVVEAGDNVGCEFGIIVTGGVEENTTYVMSIKGVFEVPSS